MAAQPMQRSPDDPSEILRQLPGKWHEQFLAEYHGALDAAHEIWRFQELRQVLRLWRLRAVAYSDPGYEQALQATREGRDEEFVPADQVIPGWSVRE